MTHVELIEKMIRDYEEEFKTDYVDDDEVKAFRNGMLYSLRILKLKLKRGMSRNDS